MSDSPWIEITCKDDLPKVGEYDWVLVRSRVMPGDYECIPMVAELRHDMWYAANVDGPVEETLGITITHWTSIPGDEKKEIPESIPTNSQLLDAEITYSCKLSKMEMVSIQVDRLDIDAMGLAISTLCTMRDSAVRAAKLIRDQQEKENKDV